MSPSRWIPLVSALAACLAIASPASAAINSPPAGGNEVTVFPERDFVAIDPGPPNTDMMLRVVRNGIVIATSDVGTSDAEGLLEVNHPGGVCWAGFTPDLLPGDEVQAIQVDGAGNPILDGGGQPIGDSTVVSGVSASPIEQVGSQLVARGVAVDAAGGPMDLASLEQRVVAPDLTGTEVAKRDIRAPGGGNGFTSDLSFDPVGPGNPDGTEWTATYSGLSQEAMDIAVAGETRILSWMTANAGGDRFGITIFEAGLTGGPGMPECPAGASNAVSSPGVINAADVAAGAPDVVFKGAAQPDATAVSLEISDGSGTVTAPATVDGGTWTASVPAADLKGLADGTLTATGTYTLPGGDVGGRTLAVMKDTVLPGDPTANPAPGTYATAQSVALSSADPTARIHYTVNGSDPSADSPVAAGQLQVSSSMTIRAIAIDAAGNRSAVSALDYTISPVQPQRIEVPVQAPPQVIVRPLPSVQPLSLGSLSMRRSITRRGLRRSGLRGSARLAKGTEVLRVRLYRVVGRKRTLVLTTYRFPSRSGRYAFVLKSKKVRGLRRGRYVLEATPGRSRQSLGVAQQVTFRVR